MTVTDAEIVWHTFGDHLKRYIARRVTLPEDAEDLLQEAFLRLQRASPENTGNIKAWLYKVVSNLITDHYRQKERENTSLEFDPPAEERFEVSESEQVVSGWLSGMLARLPDKYRVAVQLADFEGGSMISVARDLGLTLSGTKSRVQRGRKLLAAELNHCCEFYFDKRGRVAEWRKRDICC